MRRSGTIADRSEDPDGPYDGFNQAVAATTAGAYRNAIGRTLGGGPEAVARAIERAISAGRPHTRYRVTGSARLFLTLRRLLPDRLWDAMVARSFPQPKP